MRRPKSLLRVAGRTMIEHVAAALAPVTCSIVLAGQGEGLEFLGLPIVKDRLRGLGPLAGLEAGLAASDRTVNLVVACDMPCVTASLFLRLLGLRTDEDVVVPEAGGRLHPLCAVYSRDCLPEVRGRLEEGRLEAANLVRGLRCRIVRWEEECTDLPSHLLLNVNTPEDLDRAGEHLRTPRPSRPTPRPRGGSAHES
jgi:molybdopterin-guanine dinucleotide biosynthesis protein A